MATWTPTICSKSPFLPLPNFSFKASLCNIAPGKDNVAFYTSHDSFKSLSFINQPRGGGHRSRLIPIAGRRKGIVHEVGLWDEKLPTGIPKAVVESQAPDKMKLRVDLTGEQTNWAYWQVLTELHESMPRRKHRLAKKGKIPKKLIPKVYGEHNVLLYVMQEVVNSSAAIHMNKIYPDAKVLKVLDFDQSDQELIESFWPGEAFGFNVEFEIKYELPVEENEEPSPEDKSRAALVESVRASGASPEE